MLLSAIGQKAFAVWPSSISFIEEGHMDAAYIVLSIGLVTFSIGLILLCEKL
jgi:hypothetical protein